MHVSVIIEPVAPPQQLLIAFAWPVLDFKAVRRSCWRHMQCLRAVGEEVEEVAQWFKEELEPCKWCSGGTRDCCFATVGAWIDIPPALIQVVDARAGPGFKVTKPKKIKNSDGKKKSKLKRLHKLKRQGWFFTKTGFRVRARGMAAFKKNLLL